MKVAQQDLTQQGVLLLETTKDNSLPVLEIHLFTLTKWQGTETEYASCSLCAEFCPNNVVEQKR